MKILYRKKGVSHWRHHDIQEETNLGLGPMIPGPILGGHFA